jgi:hypothetical protein
MSTDQISPTPSIPQTVVAEVEAEPRWAAVLTLLIIGGLYWFIPDRLTPGPDWLLLVVIAVLLVPTVISHRVGLAKVNHYLGFAISVIITFAVCFSLITLIMGLPSKKEGPTELLRAAAAIWVSNILVFATWYWRLDAGGPSERDVRKFHTDGAFLFPQMTLPKEFKSIKRGWKPGFVDYLFLAFNTSTAFSPTDVPVLSRWAKMLMMVQSSVSLGTLAILAARAINIL